MKNLLLLIAICTFSACSDSANTEKSNEEEPQAQQSQQAQTPLIESSTQAYSRTEGRGMVQAFRSKVGSEEMKEVTFPNSLIIEKAYVKEMLEAIDENGGGLILYPVISVENGQFSLAVAPAKFATDADGRYSTGDIEVIYLSKEGVPSVYETLLPCPTHCPTEASDLNTGG